MPRLAPIVSLLFVLMMAHAAFAEPAPLTEEDYDAHARQVVPGDGLPVLTDPPLVGADDVARRLKDDDLVICIEIGSEARAYPVEVMGVHELANDTCGGRHIAISWRTLCQTAIVYGREIEGKTLTFGHAGVLYRRSFVRYDKQTDSLWAHISGEAIKGPLKGTQLAFLPSEVVTWKAWRLRHPETKVLTGKRARGAMGTFSLARALAHYGLSVGSGRDVRLYPYEQLEQTPLRNTAFGEESLRTAAFVARAGGKTLRFVALEHPERMKDKQTKSTWDRYSGLCLEGPLDGARLARLRRRGWPCAGDASSRAARSCGLRRNRHLRTRGEAPASGPRSGPRAPPRRSS